MIIQPCTRIPLAKLANGYSEGGAIDTALKNTVTNITENNNTITVTKGDGTSSSFTISTQSSGDVGDSAHTHSFATLTGKPTTLAGYGITDASPSNHTHTFSDLTSHPTTLAGYGITDASKSDHQHTFSEIQEKPTTLAGYGITDAKIEDGQVSLGGVTIPTQVVTDSSEKLATTEFVRNQFKNWDLKLRESVSATTSTTSRTWYQNTHDVPLLVIFLATSNSTMHLSETGGSTAFSTNNVVGCVSTTQKSVNGQLIFIVPPGYYWGVAHLTNTTYVTSNLLHTMTIGVSA